MSDKIKRFIEIGIPSNACNLRCHYCYVTQHKQFMGKICEFNYSPEFMAKALSKKRLGGVCMMNICANGETLLPDIVPIIRAFLEEGHYVTVVTNGTLSKKFDELKKFPENLTKRLFFKFSFHYLELVRLAILDTFVENVNKMKNAGASFTVEITPTDELEHYIQEIKDFSLKNFGALPHITIARDDTDVNVPILTKHSKREYKKIWNTFNSLMFKFKLPLYGKKRKEFCYAGDWTFYLDLLTGKMSQCYKGEFLQNIYENINEPLKFKAIGKKCLQPHCYNAHSFLLFDNIVGFSKLTYADIRNRKCLNNEQWLKPDMKKFMSSKLSENNNIYHSKLKKIMLMFKILKDEIL